MSDNLVVASALLTLTPYDAPGISKGLYTNYAKQYEILYPETFHLSLTIHKSV